MAKSRIFIASSGRTLVLAEKLRDELQTEFCEATLWSEEGRRQPGATIIEMLEHAKSTYDFAVVVLARDDVIVRETGDKQKARDNCVFEAGLFMSSLGRTRCFLVNSVPQEDLPSDLGGVISLPFSEPRDLADREACARAIGSATAILKDTVQRMGKQAEQARLPLLSVEEMFGRERPLSDGGDLREGQVLVCDIQPNPGAEVALQVRRNLRSGVNYVYFLYYAEDTVDKILQGLQMVAVGESGADFTARLEAIRREKERVLDELRAICRRRSLLISFMPTEPQFCFRVHNASDPQGARLYLRRHGAGFIPWSEGREATSVWRSLPQFIATQEPPRFFVPIKHFEFQGDALRRLELAVDQGLDRYFPELKAEIRQLCLGPDQ